jgi:hypothetical protein
MGKTEVEIVASVELIKEGKRRLIGVNVHTWKALRSRAGGMIRVEGADGSYAVYIVTDDQKEAREVYRGGLEHALRHAWKLAARYRDAGCADE